DRGVVEAAAGEHAAGGLEQPPARVRLLLLAGQATFGHQAAAAVAGAASRPLGRPARLTTTSAPRLGVSVIARRTTCSRSCRAGRSSSARAIAASTTFISNTAK